MWNHGIRVNIMKKYQSVMAGIFAGACCLARTRGNGVSMWPPTGRRVDGRPQGQRISGLGEPPGSKVSSIPVFASDRLVVKADGLVFSGGETVIGAIIDENITITGANIDGRCRHSRTCHPAQRAVSCRTAIVAITPYIGGGAGGSATVLSFDRHIDINGNRLRGSDADVGFCVSSVRWIALRDQ